MSAVFPLSRTYENDTPPQLAIPAMSSSEFASFPQEITLHGLSKGNDFRD